MIPPFPPPAPQPAPPCRPCRRSIVAGILLAAALGQPGGLHGQTAPSRAPSSPTTGASLPQRLGEGSPSPGAASPRRPVEAPVGLADAGDTYLGTGGQTHRLLRAPNEAALILTPATSPAAALEAAAARLPVRALVAGEFTRLSDGRATAVVRTRDPQMGTDFTTLQGVDGIAEVRPVLVDPASRLRMIPSGELIVRLKKGVAFAEMEALCRDEGLIPAMPVGHPRLNSFLLRASAPGTDTLALSRRLFHHPKLEWATPNFIRELERHALPNDPLFPRQFHLHNPGIEGSVPGADVGAPQAWDLSEGTSSVVIAIIDDGVDTSHPDLALHLNPGESGAGRETNGIDDDHNGLIDDYRGWDFANGDNDPNPYGSSGHGTACAGIAAGRIGNGLHVAGIAGNCRVFPVKVFTDAGPATTDANLGSALSYAAEHADVLSCSWGGGSPSVFIDSAIEDATRNGRGGLGCPVFFANGNSASSWMLVAYPVGPNLGPGTFSFGFRYQKDEIHSGGEDLVRLDNVTLRAADGTTLLPSALGDLGRQEFEGPFPPTGWTLASSAGSWWSTTPIGAFTGTGGALSARSGVLSHNQWTELRTPNVALSGGESLVAQIDVSSEADFDGLILMVYSSSGTPLGYYGLLSGVRPVNVPVAYPARHPDSLSVGASTDCDFRSDYSQHGPETDFLAPSSGGWHGVTTLDPVGAVGYSSGATVHSFGGTSAATPLAAGVGALLLSLKPDLTAIEVRDLLRQTADKVGPLPYTNGFNQPYGYGRIHAFRALEALLPDVERPEVTLTVTDATASEPGSNTALWTLHRSGDTTLPLVVQVSLEGTVTPGVDIAPLPLPVTLAAGMDSTNLLVTPLDDTAFEGEEHLRLTVLPSADYVLGPSISGTLLLADDDASPVFRPGVLKLDGRNDFATLASSLWPAASPLTAYTVEAWVRPADTAGVQFVAADDAYDLDFSADGIVHALYGPTGEFTLATFPLPPAPGSWNHVAVTFDPATTAMRVALNGVFAPGDVFYEPAFYNDAVQQFTLGARRLSPKAPAEGYFQGEIDEVRLSEGVRYVADFTPAPRFTRDALTRGLYHFEDPPLSTAFADDSGQGRHLTGIGGAHVSLQSGPEGAAPVSVAHWRFDEIAGPTAVDSSGHGNEATLHHGPVWTPDGRVNGALVLDGIDDFVTVPHAPELELGRDNADFTVSFWIYLQQGFTGAWRTILHKGNNATARTPALFLRPESNRLYYRVSTTSHPNLGGDSLGALPVQRWTHVAMVKAGSKLRLYLQGLPDSEVTLSQPVVHNSFPIHVGDDPWFSPVQARLDELRLDARALNDREIVDLAGLVAHWGFAEGLGSTATDLSPYHNDATLGPAPQAPQWFSNGSDSALAFDGIDDVLTVPHAPTLELGRDNADFSVAFWVRLRQGATGAWRTILHKGNNLNARTPGVFLWPNSNRLYYRVSTSTSWNSGGSSVAELPLDAWTHVAMVRNAASLRLYLNGALDSQVTLPGPVSPSTSPLHIGDDPWFGAVRADLDDLRLYQTALPASVVATLAALPIDELDPGIPDAPDYVPLAAAASLHKSEALQSPAGDTTPDPVESSPAPDVTRDGDTLIVRWTLPAALRNAAWRLEHSDDLLRWSPLPEAAATVLDDGTGPRLEGRLPLGTAPHRFLRAVVPGPG